MVSKGFDSEEVDLEPAQVDRMPLEPRPRCGMMLNRYRLVLSAS